MDIFPTLLEVAGLTPSPSLNGRSFLPTLRGQFTPPEERPLYFTRREGGTDYGGQCIYALRLGPWKLLQNTPYEPMELYNLDVDPLEKKNLRAEHPEVYKKLNGLLMQHIQQSGKVPWQKPDPSE
jgi:arylsulfatase A-like enzyme